MKVMEKQRQDVDVVRFLIGLKPEYESIRGRILGGSDIPSQGRVYKLKKALYGLKQSPRA
jgi:hypothetical protein